MSKKALVFLTASVLAVGGGAAALAASLGGSDDNQIVHTMSNGQTMTGHMSDSHTMSDGSSMTGDSMSNMHDSGK